MAQVDISIIVFLSKPERNHTPLGEYHAADSPFGFVFSASKEHSLSTLFTKY